MKGHLAFFVAVASLLASPALAPAAPSSLAVSSQAAERDQWVAQCYMNMETIKVGMTRANLMKVFTTEGGESTRERQTFVYPDCCYFKVDVRFEPIGPALGVERENPNDKITSISGPYIALKIMD